LLVAVVQQLILALLLLVIKPPQIMGVWLMAVFLREQGLIARLTVLLQKQQVLNQLQLVQML